MADDSAMQDATPPASQAPPPDADTANTFSLEERIAQLCEIDKNIVALMSHTATALTSLSPQPHIPQTQQTETFKSAMDGLLSTLHTVDVRMKRQILALEEAGIIRLRQDARVMNEDAKIVAKPSLEPNGVGGIGALDVGWLNSRNSKVERDMEAELWARMRALLERQGGEAGRGDDEMES
ncbi:hypothetical protein HYQ45_010614 [Verticillium longisporum]|uniref:Mediator of RNA polymerase II transcription subunit 11 n=2 Tax=Verticillium TaxID=1036719 RepID=A0A2J8D5C8_VERDA|nr:COBW domain-containing protein 1 [Verticillium dahliae VDG2]KAF3357025.1 hypothetical protein VdG1_03583 [Verticillium dahliae VDG1]KAG7130611.1 hypothetical protein HYQ45_010614 [Verticillium longisporum]KAH6689351.1 mediator complex protein-domain-containing protein [Verticillium dahliae]PNH26613.1 hypothetical protein BJF96_g10067 [Verticillium dahliae]